MREKLGKNVKNHFGEIQFGKNIKILIMVAEMQTAWQINFDNLVKFAKSTQLFSCQTSLYMVL